MIFTHQLYLILFICLPSTALTTIILTPNQTSLNTDGDGECIPKPSIFTKVPNFADCITAITQLPRFDGVDSFHTGPPDDPYKLPIRKPPVSVL